MQAPCAHVDRGEWYLLETHLAREEAIKAAPAVGERPSRAQEVVKVVLGSTAGAGGDSSTLLKSHSVGKATRRRGWR
jgi:hypothetical protein